MKQRHRHRKLAALAAATVLIGATPALAHDGPGATRSAGAMEHGGAPGGAALLRVAHFAGFGWGRGGGFGWGRGGWGHDGWGHDGWGRGGGHHGRGHGGGWGHGHGGGNHGGGHHGGGWGHGGGHPCSPG